MLTVKQKFGYGLGDTASNIVFQAVANFMLIFYTDVFGISPAVAGSIIFFVRITDAITDPIMGGIADRTRTKWGSYRPYLLWLALPFAVLAVLAFTTPDMSDSAKIVYAVITYSLMMLMYTAINIPYSALGGVMTSDPTERVSLQSYRFAMAMVGAMLVVWAVPQLVNVIGQGDDAKGYQMSMIILGFAAVGCFVLCFMWTKEYEKPPSAGERGSIVFDFLSLFKNDQWLVVAGVSFLVLVLFGLRISVAPHYVKYYMGLDGNFLWGAALGTILLLANVAAFAGALFANFLSRNLEKKNLLLIGAAGNFVASVILIFLPGEAIWPIVITFMLAQFFQNIIVILMFSMVADTVDYGAFKMGRKIMGMTFSGHLLAVKGGFAVGGASAGWLLSYYGYQANQAQSQETLDGMVHIFATFPAVCGLICAGLVLLYKLDSKRILEIQEANKNTLIEQPAFEGSK